MKPTNGMCFIRPEFHNMSESGIIDISRMAYRHLPGVGEITHLPAGKHEVKIGQRVVFDHRKSNLDKIPARYTDNLTVAVVPIEFILAILEKTP